MAREIYAYRPPRKRRRKLLFKVVLVLIILVAAFAALKAANRNSKTSLSTGQPHHSKNQPQILEANGRYLFSGTTVLARKVQDYSHGNFNQPFIKMNTFGTYDAREMDLECPVTDSSFSYGGDENPRFNCNTKWLAALKKYYRIVKVAGNHTYDMGAAGFSETIRHLQAAGIQAVGHYNPHLNKAHNCEVVALPIRLKNSNEPETKATLPVAFCAFNYKILFSPEPGEMEQISDYAKVMPVFGLLQAGAEYQTTASSLQQIYARKMIDLGADFVIANGAHYIQNSEAYKGKLIVYSLGNFIFDQIVPETNRGLSIAVDMNVKYDNNVSKWLALTASCSAAIRGDACLAAANAQNLSKISFGLKYEPIGNISGAIPVTQRVDAIAQRAIETRLNWPTTCSGLVGSSCK